MANGRKRTRKFKIPFWPRERISKDTHLEFFSTLRQTETKSTRKTRRIPDASSDLSVIFFFSKLSHITRFPMQQTTLTTHFFRKKSLFFSYSWQRLVQKRWFVVVGWNDFANNRALPFFVFVHNLASGAVGKFSPLLPRSNGERSEGWWFQRAIILLLLFKKNRVFLAF